MNKKVVIKLPPFLIARKSFLESIHTLDFNTIWTTIHTMRQISNEPHKIFFETLGNKTRWDIVHLLQKGAYKSTQIAVTLGYEQSLISHHLRRLEACGFVSFKKNGSERIYELNGETIKPLLALMDKHIGKFCKKLCCQWFNE